MHGSVRWMKLTPSLCATTQKMRAAAVGWAMLPAHRNRLRLVAVFWIGNRGGHAYPGDAMVSLAGQRSKAMSGGFMAATRPALQVPSAPSTWTLLKIGGVSLFRLPETKKNPPTRVFWCW